MEIERKFLLDANDIPYDKLRCLDFLLIKQFYIPSANKEERYREVMSLVNTTRFVWTIKEETDLIIKREEEEKEISKEVFEENLRNNPCNILRKIRTVIKYEEFILFIDAYLDVNLCFLEIEFNTEERAMQFIPYSWFGKEVTGVDEYKNYYLWSWLNEDGGINW